ncbi:hypothetical protein GCM10027160_31160 [Streptomyces calidiresistens]
MHDPGSETTAKASGETPGRLVIVDGANVVGSVPDGWWRDRHGAAERLRDALAERAAAGSVLSPGPGGRTAEPGAPGEAEEVVLVVEGAARRVEAVPGVRVEATDGSGDDLIVALVAGEAAGTARPCTVVTADRALRDRVRALGADTTGPRTVRPGRSRHVDRPRDPEAHGGPDRADGTGNPHASGPTGP